METLGLSTISNEFKASNDLTGPKLGLAAGMFIYTTLACIIPLLLLYFMDKSSPSTTSDDEMVGEDGQLRTTRCKCSQWTAETRARIISRSNCLAAGALLSVGFLHVLMETMESFEDALESVKTHTDFPLACFITLLGFLLILGVEQLTLDYFHNHQAEKAFKRADGSNIQGASIRRHRSNRSSLRERVASLTAVAEAIAMEPDTLIETHNMDIETKNAGHSHNPIVMNSSGGWVRVLTLLCAISLHSIFEGMALGLCKSLTSLLTLFAALSLHKVIIAVSIGINLTAETTKNSAGDDGQGGTQSKRLYLYQALAILTFAGASPLGALIGWGISSYTHTSGFLFASSILQGLACGTFLYVVFCELLPREMGEGERDKPGKFLFLVLGFTVVALVIALGPAEPDI